jgi:replicative DNA helicase
MRKETAEPQKAGEVRLDHDVVNEAVVVAAACCSAEARTALVERVPADAFLEPRHSAAWTALRELERQHLAFDVATLPTLAAGVDASYIDELLKLRPTPPPNLEHHVQTLFWDRARVNAWGGPIAQLIQAVRDPRADRARVQALVRQIGQAFDGFGDRQHLEDPSRVVRDQVEEIRQRRDGKALYPLGIQAIDAVVDSDGCPVVMPGLAPGQVTLVTGITGSGKSTFVANLILGQARRKRKVLVGAWELNSGLTLELLATISLGWSRSAVTLGNVTDEHLQQLEDKMVAISRWVRFVRNPFNLDEELGAKPSNNQNLDLIRGYIADTGCDVSVFDLWERCLVDDSPGGEKFALYRQQKIADKTRSHVVIVQQQNVKQLMARDDKRPSQETVKGNGAYVEIADNIFGCHRPAMFKAVPDNTAEILFLKQRRGRSGFIVECDWDADRGQLSNGREVQHDHGGSSGAMEEFLGTSKRKGRDR